MRRNGACRDLAPRNVYRQHQDDVGKQRECQPLEVAHVTLIGQQHLQHQANDADRHGVDLWWTSDQQVHRVAHRRDIGSDVDGVGDYQQCDDAIKHRPRKMAPDIGRETVARDAPDPCAHQLDADHQGIGEDDCPQSVEAELRARLRIRRDARRVVVGRAGDQSGAELPCPIAHPFHAVPRRRAVVVPDSFSRVLRRIRGRASI